MLAVIGCGNLNRKDDAVGVVVARRLAERLRLHPVPGVRAFDCGTGGMEVMFAARGCDALLILDASKSGAEPGAIYEVPGAELESAHEPAYTLHDFRWDHALMAGRRIFREQFPKEVQVWLVEAADTSLGLELTPKVAEAAEALYQRVLAFVADYAARRHADRGEAELAVKRGAIHLSQEVYTRYFDARSGAVLFARGEELCVMPVEEIAGGLLVKQKNAKGDRSIDAAELIRARGWDDLGEHTLTGRWDSELGALAIAMPKRSES